MFSASVLCSSDFLDLFLYLSWNLHTRFKYTVDINVGIWELHSLKFKKKKLLIACSLIVLKFIAFHTVGSCTFLLASLDIVCVCVFFLGDK